MRILFTADIHINLTKKNVPRDWQTNRYHALFKKLHDLSIDVDICVLGGDIFDKKPTIVEEFSLYGELISGFKTPTFIYDGNHEATKKGHTFLHALKNMTNMINSNAHILTEPCEIHHIDFIPYTHIKTFNPKDFHNKILCTHVRGSIPPHVTPEIDLDLLNQWDVVLAGDLHAYSNSQRNILYPGSPISISFHRSKIKNGVIIFDTDTMDHEWIELGLPQLLKETVDSEDQIIQTKYDHTIYELVGNISSLSNVDANKELLAKKLVDKDYSSTLPLINTKSIEEEIELILRTIYKLDETQINEILKEYHDNV